MARYICILVYVSVPSFFCGGSSSPRLREGPANRPGCRSTDPSVFAGLYLHAWVTNYVFLFLVRRDLGIGFSFRYGALVPSCVPNLWTRHLSRPSHHIVVLATAKSRSPIHGACMIWLSIGAWPSCGHVWSLDTFSWTGTVTVGTTEMIVPVPLVRTAPMCLRLYPCWRVDQFVSHNAWSTPFSS
jgi:hypothetical protein